MKTQPTYIARPTVEMIGQDGNAFAIIGRCQRAARQAGWTPEQITALVGDLTACTYDHLLGVVMTRFDVQ